MKFLVLFIAILVVSCTKMDETNILSSDCIPMVQNVTFKTEAFKESYTIQFPADYAGEGLVIDESASFEKQSPSEIVFKYEFLSSIDNHYSLEKN